MSRYMALRCNVQIRATNGSRSFSNGEPPSTSTASTTWPRLRRSVSASANSVSSSVENAMITAPAGTAARGASVPVVDSTLSPAPRTASTMR